MTRMEDVLPPAQKERESRSRWTDEAVWNAAALVIVMLLCALTFGGFVFASVYLSFS